MYIFVIRELQIKIIRYHYKSSRMTKIQNTDNINHWQECRAIKLSFISGRNSKCYTATLGVNLAVSCKSKHNITIWYSNPSSRLFTLLIWKHLSIQKLVCFIHNCQKLEATKVSFNRWTNKLCYILTIKY